MRKIKIICTIVIITICLYSFFLMPLPYNESSWKSHTARNRMVSSVTRKVIGLSKDEVIALLGESEGGEGHFTAPGQGLYYVLGIERNFLVASVKVDVFVVYFDENHIAVDCGIMKG